MKKNTDAMQDSTEIPNLELLIPNLKELQEHVETDSNAMQRYVREIIKVLQLRQHNPDEIITDAVTNGIFRDFPMTTKAFQDFLETIIRLQFNPKTQPNTEEEIKEKRNKAKAFIEDTPVLSETKLTIKEGINALTEIAKNNEINPDIIKQVFQNSEDPYLLSKTFFNTDTPKETRKAIAEILWRHELRQKRFLKISEQHFVVIKKTDCIFDYNLTACKSTNIGIFGKIYPSGNKYEYTPRMCG